MAVSLGLQVKHFDLKEFYLKVEEDSGIDRFVSIEYILNKYYMFLSYLLNMTDTSSHEKAPITPPPPQA